MTSAGHARYMTFLAVLVVSGGGAGCGAAAPGRVASGAGAREGAAASRAPSSTVLRQDYAGSKACEPCHADVYAAWKRSPMHEMTRLPDGARVRAPFDGAEFHFKDDRARFEQKEGARFVRVESPRFGNHLYQVTKVIGGRYREDYAGVEVRSDDRSDGDVGAPAPRPELILPVSFVFESRSFRLKGYSVMVGERPGLRAGGVWSQTCVFCHNTSPYFDSVWGELHGPGAPGYQGEVVDHVLPPERRWTFSITDEAALADAVRGELAFVSKGAGAASPGPAGGDGARQQLLGAGIQTLRQRFQPEHLVEIGIGCESCHGGSHEHADDSRVVPDFVPRSRFMKVIPAGGAPEPSRAEAINRTCARCHQVLFTRYPFTWEGGQRRGGPGSPPGGSSITSGEARDFLLGGCARRMSCTTCHDPHAEDRPEKLAALQTPAGNGVCTTCHPAYAGAEALRRHAHHDPAGAGGSCVACHMARKNMGLGYALTRYHRIGSPTDKDRVLRDRPLECALCHADRSAGALVADMERLWGKSYDRTALRALYGDLDANALRATVERGRAHEQAPAIAVLGEQRVRAALPAVARQLTNPYPLVRYYAKRAVEAIRGAPCAIDLDGPTAAIEAAARRCGAAAAPVAPGRSTRGDDAGED